MYEPKLEKDIRCPLEYGLRLFGGKWKTRIICRLSEAQPLRYGQLRSQMTGITDAVLATTLKEMIADGMVSRQSYNEMPPRVEYTLTEKAVSAIPVIHTICAWSADYHQDYSMSQCQSCPYKYK